MKKKEYLRFAIVLACICVLYLTVVVKLFYWQVVSAEDLRDLAKAQSSETIDIPAVRGEILSSDGFPLATNTISYTLYSNPKIITDKKKYAEVLAPVLSRDTASVSALLDQDLYWVRLANKVDGTLKSQIEALKLPGIGFEEEYQRFYPEASMAAHLIGFVGHDAKGENHGYFGIEGEYNDQLAGRSGALHAIRDALGNAILNDIREDSKIDGRNIKLTVDRTVQFSVDKRLSDGIAKYNADGGSAIVMDTKTGKILAMASYPKFDPQKFYEYEGSAYTNPALSSLYEPGSTFKVLVMAAAINENLITPETHCNICSAPIELGEYKIRTWNNEYYPSTTMNDVIVHSDNTGMVFVGKKLGVDRMISYLERYGMGQTTDIDLQGESSGVLREKDSWHPIDLATSSFGQGISVTPIQLITAVNSIANGGKLAHPYIVSQIETPDGKVININPKPTTRVISNAASKSVAKMMLNAVENGEAKWTKVKNYKIAGKTGTAQIPVAGHYDPNHTVASFVGFFPANDPKVTMLIVVNRPKTSIYGAETAAPIFFSIARDLIKYYNLPPNN